MFNTNGRHYTLERSKIRVLITDEGVTTGGAIGYLSFFGHHGEGKKDFHTGTLDANRKSEFPIKSTFLNKKISVK